MRKINKKIIILPLLVICFAMQLQADWSRWIYYGKITNGLDEEILRVELQAFGETGERPQAKWRVINYEDSNLDCVKLGKRTYELSDGSKKTLDSEGCYNIPKDGAALLITETIGLKRGLRVVDANLEDISFKLNGESKKIAF